jgi:hypothetical protein
MLPWFDEVKSFTERMHNDVMMNVLRLFALGLGLDAETFVSKHKFEFQD